MTDQISTNVIVKNPYNEDKSITITLNTPDPIVQDVVKEIRKTQNDWKKRLFVLTSGGQILCPKKQIKDIGDLTIQKVNIVLDIDETLIHALTVSEIPSQNNINKFPAFVMDDVKDDPDPYVVIVRPGLFEFLDKIFKISAVSIWTAASRDYATWIIKNVLFKNKKGEPVKRDLKIFLSSKHCDISYDKKDGHKVLDLLQSEFNLPQLDKDAFDPNDVCVLIDDSGSAHEANKEEQQIHACYRILPFEMKSGTLDENDNQLPKLSKKFDYDNVQNFLFNL